jgi:GAF domain-containing protein/HAMP domain-containing protein
VILNLADPTIQYIAWILAMMAGTLALYILVLNWQNPTNQLVALLLAVVGINNYAEGVLIGAGDSSQAYMMVVLLAITTPMTLPLLMVVTPRLLKPDWLENRWRWAWWGMGFLALLPGILTLVDLLVGTRLYFTSLASGDYQGGFVKLAVYTGGVVAPVVKAINIYVLFLFLVGFYVYVAIFDKNATRNMKILAWFLFGAVGISGTFLIAFQPLLPLSLGPLLTGSLFAFVYGYAAFQQMISERRKQKGSLRVRLTVLVLAVTAPLLFALVFLATARVSAFLEQRSLENLQTANQAVISNVTLWLDDHTRALRQAASLPDVTSMEADRQKPVLESLAATYDYMYLVSTTDMNGMNLARSDDESPKDYADREWYKDVIGGKRAAYQILVGRTSGQPSLVMAVPIYGEDLKVAGVLMFASEIEELQKRIGSNVFGKTGYVFLVDEQNQVIIHPELSYITELRDLSAYPPVVTMRQGIQGQVRFADDEGVRWRATVAQSENGWGVIAQQTEAEILSPLQTLRQISLWISLAGLLFLSVVVWLTVRQSLSPVQSLTSTASAILEGNLNRKAPVESDDELGFLAEMFNRMTRQLRESISNLEERIARRTADLERRSNQLRAAAMVSKEAAGIRDIQQMLSQTTQLISRYFDFYHAGIFIVDDAREYAVLQAANSEGGQRMLARGHKLRVGQVGMVGYVADVGVPRIALDVGEDAVFFNNPDLPMTRSEMALPLKARDLVIGVLDVQSIEESAFSNEDIETLQVMADQIALALDNAQLLKESRDALEELQMLYGQQTRQVWKEHLEGGALSFKYSRTGLISGEDVYREGSLQEEDKTARVTSPVLRTKDGKHEMQVPLVLRGQMLGSLILRREIDQKPWTQDDLRLATDLIAQVLPALENARLLEEIQERAQMEGLIGQVSSRIQSSLDLETVLKTAVQEIGLAVNATRVQIRLEKDGEGGNSTTGTQ